MGNLETRKYSEENIFFYVYTIFFFWASLVGGLMIKDDS